MGAACASVTAVAPGCARVRARELHGHDGVAALRQRAGEALARADAELHEHRLQVPFDGAWADEELGADLRVGPAGEREPRDVLLLRRELIARVVRALADRLTG